MVLVTARLAAQMGKDVSRYAPSPRHVGHVTGFGRHDSADPHPLSPKNASTSLLKRLEKLKYSLQHAAYRFSYQALWSLHKVLDDVRSYKLLY